MVNRVKSPSSRQGHGSILLRRALDSVGVLHPQIFSTIEFSHTNFKENPPLGFHFYQNQGFLKIK